MAQSPSLVSFFVGPPSERHVGVCAIYSETTVLGSNPWSGSSGSRRQRHHSSRGRIWRGRKGENIIGSNRPFPFLGLLPDIYQTYSSIFSSEDRIEQQALLFGLFACLFLLPFFRSPESATGIRIGLVLSRICTWVRVQGPTLLSLPRSGCRLKRHPAQTVSGGLIAVRASLWRVPGPIAWGVLRPCRFERLKIPRSETYPDAV